MSKLIASLRRASADLRAVGARSALIGGLAVSVRTEPRTTRDADFVEMGDLSALDANARWVLMLQLDAAWVSSRADPTALRRLRLPAAAAGRLRRPAGVLKGSVAVVRVGDRLGAFPRD